MQPRPAAPSKARAGPRASLVLPGGAGAALYCWWATGQRPFSAASYLAVGLPVVLAGAALLARRGRRPGPAGAPARWPWAVLALLAAGLEGASLALGGNDSAFPSLSTIGDQLLRWHGLRAVLFSLWLLSGTLLSWPRRREGSREEG